MAALTQKNWDPKRARSHWGSIQSGPSEGVITRTRVCRPPWSARILACADGVSLRDLLPTGRRVAACA
ncbi:hypothetical protein GCM10009867_27150 [Pedococcus aerophilus]|uniref:Uncharacterized protein n=1 Tax=Pedococcus aerophilus TaxID=436356 RepID=A0ABN3USP6_9MICO